MTNNIQKYKQYKSSGVEWLGDVPEHWEVKRLKYLGKIYPGLNGKKGDDFSKIKSSDKKPFVPFTNIYNNVSISETEFQYVKISENEIQNKVLNNDILFLMSSETLEDIGKTSIYLGDNEELYLNSFCKGFRINEENIFPEFVNYLFSSTPYRTYFAIVGRGFTRINIKQDYINNLITLIPTREEQTKIANYLDRKTAQIDQAIAQKEQLIELLKERQQVLIHKAVTQGLDDSVDMKDSGVEWIGDVPKHWEVKKLKYLVSIQGGFAFSSINFKEGGVQLLKIANLYMNKLSLERQPTFLDEKFLQSHKEWIVSKGDILMSLTGTLGKKDYGFAIFLEKNEKYFLNQRVARLRCNQNIEAGYVVKILQSDMYLNQLYQLPSGTKQANLSNDNVVNIKIPIPPKSERIQIFNYLKTQTEKIQTSIQQQTGLIARLKEYKTVLIDAAVTGKVRVEN